MRRLGARLLLAVLALAAAGCSTVGNGRLVALDAPQAQALLVPDHTTRDDVREALGDGAIVHFQSGMETWRYQYREGVAKGWDQVPYIGLITARLDRPTKELVILFDASGVLKRWSLQEYRTRPPTSAG
jgi:outer membrane protein assembly factor BamE (lipoprotein component of BamABCDE complex)